jgi:cytoskeletal protein CcmA (bactofilin family)
MIFDKKERKMKRILTLILFVLFTLIASGCATVSTSGDYTLKSGQTLSGNLVLTSGNAILEEDTRVTGNVIMTSGDLLANGEIEGGILLFSGDVTLGPEAVVHGDIRGTSGDVVQLEGAQVFGQISMNESSFTIGRGIIASFVVLLCFLPLVVIVVFVVLVAALVRRKPSAVPQEQVTIDDATQKLKQLKGMLDEGLITESEYESKKAEILAGM